MILAEKQRSLQLKLSNSVNEDKLMIEKFHGGAATKAFLPNLTNYAKAELLMLPESIKLYSKSEPTKAKHTKFDSFEKSEKYTSDFVSSNYSTERSVGVDLPIYGPAKVGLGYSDSNSSSNSQKNASGSSKSVKEMSVVIHEYIPKGSFDLPPSEILLSKAANKRALRINNLKDAFDFFEEFGAFYPVCTFTVGGIFMCEIKASSKSSSNMSDFETSASSAISSKVNASIGVGGFGLSGSYGTSSGNTTSNQNKNEKENSEINIEVKCMNYGPQHVNIDEFRKALDKDKSEWTSIGCQVNKLKPIYELIEDTDNDELKKACFYLKVADIFKNAEKNMLAQLKKRFKETNTKFDIELYLKCFSKDLQEMAIEEFTMQDKQDLDMFEKWTKQVFNNATNQNLDTLPKLIELDLDFQDTNVNINNIYLESECHFAFILYYRDKDRRLYLDQWNDLLECLKEIRKKNENKGHYVLVNLDLHDEVNETDMCLKVYENGKQKTLCFVNQDFLDHHKIDHINEKLSLKEKVFTYYFEDNVFAEFKNLNELKLTQGRLKSINKNSLAGLKKLECIDFEDNHISLIEEGCFEHLDRIKYIKLSKNRIDKLSKEMLRGLETLDSFEIDYNQLKSVPELTFVSLKNLTVLKICNNNLSSIMKKSFAGLEKLKILYLNENRISSIDDSSFNELENLVELNLSNNKLTEITNDIFDGLDKLEILDLSNNSIRKLDDKALKPLLENLKTLKITGNHIDMKTVGNYYGGLENFKMLKN